MSDIFGDFPYIFIFLIPLLFFLLTVKLQSWGIILLLIAISISPRIPVGELSHGKNIDIRIEDILLIFLLFGWFLRFKYRPLKKSPFLKPIFLYLVISVLSTSTGVFLEWIDLTEGTFFLLKEVEYFFIFLLIANNIVSRKQVGWLMIVWLAIGIVDFIWKAGQLILGIPFLGYGPDSPFETYAGVQSGAAPLYPLAISISLLGHTGLAANTGLMGLILLFSISLILAAKRSFIWGAGGGLAVTGLLSVIHMKKGSHILKMSCIGICFLVISYFSIPSFFPEFTGHSRLIYSESHVVDFRERVEIGKYSLQNSFLRNPLLGVGKGSFPTPGATHNFYVRILCDVGIIGFSIFMWLWVLLWRNIFSFYKSASDRMYRAIALSWMFVTLFVGIANFFGEYLLTVRPAESYWFISGMAVGVMNLAKRDNAKAEAESLEEKLRSYKRFT